MKAIIIAALILAAPFSMADEAKPIEPAKPPERVKLDVPTAYLDYIAQWQQKARLFDAEQDQVIMKDLIAQYQAQAKEKATADADASAAPKR